MLEAEVIVDAVENTIVPDGPTQARACFQGVVGASWSLCKTCSWTLVDVESRFFCLDVSREGPLSPKALLSVNLEKREGRERERDDTDSMDGFAHAQPSSPIVSSRTKGAFGTLGEDFL